MAQGSNNDDLPTVDDMQSWLRREIAELAKATELRLADATDFVTAYAAGRLTAQQAEDRLLRYQDRWGDSPIPGVTLAQGMKDDEILERLDAEVHPDVRKSPWWGNRQRDRGFSR